MAEQKFNINEIMAEYGDDVGPARDGGIYGCDAVSATVCGEQVNQASHGDKCEVYRRKPPG